MRKFQCLLSVLKRSCIWYYIICMTVPLTTLVTLKVIGVDYQEILYCLLQT